MVVGHLFLTLLLFKAGLGAFVIGPCLLQHVVSPLSLQYLAYDAPRDEIYLDFPVGSAGDFRFTICYYGEDGYYNYFTRIAPNLQTSYFLTDDGFDAQVLFGGTAPVASKFDYRLHRSNIASPTTLNFLIDSSGRYLYPRSDDSAGYRSFPDYPWEILPVSTFTGNIGTTIFGGSLPATAAISSSSSGDASKEKAASESLVFNPLCVLVHREGSRVSVKPVYEASKAGFFRFTANGYTVYTGVSNDSNSTDGVVFSTNKAVVFYEQISKRFLAPELTGNGVVSMSNALAVQKNDKIVYGKMKALHWPGRYGPFEQFASKNKLRPIVADNVKSQRYPDERFYYPEPSLYGRFRLQLSNQPGLYLAMLKVGDEWQLVTTKLRDELPQLIFSFQISLPDEKYKPNPPSFNIN